MSEDTRTAIEVLRALNEASHLSDYIYDIRDSEGKNWEGPRVIKWGDAVARAQELLEEDELEREHGEDSIGVKIVREARDEGIQYEKKEEETISTSPLTSLRRGTYIGPRPKLIGKTALLKVFDAGIKAQFDDVSTGLGHGWYVFVREDWKIDWRLDDE